MSGRRDCGHRGEAELTCERRKLAGDRLERILRVTDEVHLVDRRDHLPNSEERADEQVAPGLGEQALASVDQDEDKLRRGGARRHVARVLLVAGRVGYDERTLRGREMAIGDVDGDTLFALGLEAVEQQGKIDLVACGPESL